MPHLTHKKHSSRTETNGAMAGNGGPGTAPSSAQELPIITGFSASLAIADGSLSLMQSGGLCLPSWLPFSQGPHDRGGERACQEQAISSSAAGQMHAPAARDAERPYADKGGRTA